MINASLFSAAGTQGLFLGGRWVESYALNVLFGLLGLGWIVVGVSLVRVVCELLILIFRICEAHSETRNASPTDPNSQKAGQTP